jgi:hypothetical protein
MKIGLTTLLLLVLAPPAQAQSQGPPDPQPQQQQIHRDGRVRGMQGSQNPRGSAADQQKARDVEKAYNETIKHIPSQKPADPWGKMR